MHSMTIHYILTKLKLATTGRNVWQRQLLLPLAY